jgi:hypothetical protein
MAICSSETYKGGMQVYKHTRVPYEHNGHRRHRRHPARRRLRPVQRAADTTSKPPLRIQGRLGQPKDSCTAGDGPLQRRSRIRGSTRRYQRTCGDVWEDPEDGPTSVTAPMTVAQLQQHMEARLLTRKWIRGGVVAGSIAAVTVIGLCLWRHRQAVLTYKARCARGRTVAVHT